MNAETEILVRAINGFFHIYLPRQRCFSKNTVDSYKTAFNLFLDYMLEQHDFPLHQHWTILTRIACLVLWIGCLWFGKTALEHATSG